MLSPLFLKIEVTDYKNEDFKYLVLRFIPLSYEHLKIITFLHIIQNLVDFDYDASDACGLLPYKSLQFLT
jgi:hypothetical protein